MWRVSERESLAARAFWQHATIWSKYPSVHVVNIPCSIIGGILLHYRRDSHSRAAGIETYPANPASPCESQVDSHGIHISPKKSSLGAAPICPTHSAGFQALQGQHKDWCMFLGDLLVCRKASGAVLHHVAATRKPHACMA